MLSQVSFFILCQESCLSLLLFAATRSDELEWVKYTNQQQKVTARKHIMEVQHTRAQLATGRGLLV